MIKFSPSILYYFFINKYFEKFIPNDSKLAQVEIDFKIGSMALGSMFWKVDMLKFKVFSRFILVSLSESW